MEGETNDLAISLPLPFFFLSFSSFSLSHFPIIRTGIWPIAGDAFFPIRVFL